MPCYNYRRCGENELSIHLTMPVRLPAVPVGTRKPAFYNYFQDLDLHFHFTKACPTCAMWHYITTCAIDMTLFTSLIPAPLSTCKYRYFPIFLHVLTTGHQCQQNVQNYAIHIIHCCCIIHLGGPLCDITRASRPRLHTPATCQPQPHATTTHDLVPSWGSIRILDMDNIKIGRASCRERV